jgi:hypothetical protein
MVSMLIPDERRMLLTTCSDHAVAVCLQCSEAVTFERIGADLMGRRDFCPVCRADLTAALRQHLAECTLIRVQEREIRERAREDVRQPSQSARQAGASARHSEPTAADAAGEAIWDSKRLRERGRWAIHQAQQIGVDYIPMRGSASASE